MKTLSLSLLFAAAIGIAPVSTRAITLAPTPSPTASPIPATEPEHAAGGTCPDCGMDNGAPGKDAKAGADGKDQAAKESETEKAVVQLEVKWCEAEARHDVAFLEKMESAGFTFTDSTGKVTSKKDEIEEAKQGGNKIDFKLSDMKAHVYGGTVILTGQTTFNPSDPGPALNAYRWTDVFVRQANGEWQVVASQATMLGQGGTAESGQTE